MKPLIRNSPKYFLNQQGFTLIEILVALFLIAMVMGLAISNPFSNSRELESEVKNIERAIQFLSDESALRNTVTRLHFLMNKEPQQYAVEYSESSQLVLPSKSESETSAIGKEEEEKKQKAQKDFDNNFARISEFQESNKEFNGTIKIIAVGTAQSSVVQSNGDFSVYSFPSGEKDEVFIAMASDEEIATITTHAFTSKIEHNYYPLGKIDEKELFEHQKNKAKELFDEWKKDHH